MIGKYLLPLFILGSIYLPTLSQGWVYSGAINGTYIEPKYSCIDHQNNLLTLGVFSGAISAPFVESAYGSGNDLILIKYSSSGEILWYSHIGSPANDIAGGITIDENNDIYVSGNYQGDCTFDGSHSLTNSGGMDAFLAKYSSSGNFQWGYRVAGGINNQYITDLQYDNYSRSLIISGCFYETIIIGNSPSNYKTVSIDKPAASYISKFNMIGELLLVESIPQDYNLSRIYKIGIGPNGYYFYGNHQQKLYFKIDTINSLSAQNDVFLYRTDFNLQGNWIRRLRGSLVDNARALTVDEFDNIYILVGYNSPTILIDSTENIVVTSSGTTGSADYDNLIAKFNRNGVLQWYVKRGGVGVDYYYDLNFNNNILYTVGYFADQLVLNSDTLKTSSVSNSDAYLGIFNTKEDPIGGISIVGSGDNYDSGITIDSYNNSNAFITGYFRSPQITIGTQTYNHPNPGTSNLFFAIYQHPFEAVITDEAMVSCNGANDGMLTVTGYFGRPPYTYQWSHNASLNNPVATGLAPGTYTVTIRDADNKTASVTRDVTQPASLTIDGIVSQVSCFNGGNGAIGITVTGGSSSGTYTYRWSTLDGSGIIPVNEDQNNLSSGTYKVEVTDDNLCTATKNFIVAEPAPFDYTGSFATPITSPPGGNGAITINITGGNTPYKTYRWNGPSGYLNNTEDITGLGTSGLYYFTLTDAKDCVSDTSFAVLDNITFIAQITSKTDITCKDDDNGTASVTVHNATGTVTYAWTGFAPTTNNTINNMPPGKYTMVATDQGGHTATDTITIFEPKDLFLYPLEKLDPLCNGDNKGVVNLTLTGGTLPYSFNWNNGYYTGEDLVNVPGGTYTVVVTDANGCVKSTNTTVVEPALIGLFITQEEEILCNGGNSAVALAHGSGGTPEGTFTYLWDDPGAQITPAANELEAGNYSVTITDNNGCSRSASITIDEPDLLAITSQIVSPSCPGDEDGSIVPTPTGGTGTGYEYIWSNNVYQRFNTDLEAGQYILTLNDANNCILIDTFDLADPDTVKITSVIPSSPTCEGLEDGSINITATGGNGIYEYSVDGGITYNDAANVTSLSQGDYVVRVRDGNECVSETTPVSLTLSDACGLIIYDAFSPDNGDDLNDVWTIENAENFPGIKVNIFNIWGIEVFSSTGYEEPWDGTYNGKELPSGTYYYVIDPGDGSKTRSGSVNIVK